MAPPRTRTTHIHRAGDLARQSLGEARRSIRALRPQILEHGDWWDSLDAMTKTRRRRNGASDDLHDPWAASFVGPGHRGKRAAHLQEILTNVLKHSGATMLKRRLFRFERTPFAWKFGNNGRGFDQTKKHDGLGLIGIRER